MFTKKISRNSFLSALAAPEKIPKLTSFSAGRQEKIPQTHFFQRWQPEKNYPKLTSFSAGSPGIPSEPCCRKWRLLQVRSH
jgi:hypothetical protein